MEQVEQVVRPVVRTALSAQADSKRIVNKWGAYAPHCYFWYFSFKSQLQLQAGKAVFKVVEARNCDYNDGVDVNFGANMAALTIRNIDDEVKNRLRLQAAQHGCSMEQEVRDILLRAVAPKLDQASFAQKIQKQFCDLNVDTLPIPERKIARTPPEMAG